MRVSLRVPDLDAISINVNWKPAIFNLKDILVANTLLI